MRKYYHDRGWMSAHKQYEGLLAEVLSVSAKVLDVGCGQQFPMAEYLSGIAAEVHGVDPVADEKTVVDGAVVRQGWAERLPYPDEMFDVVASKSVLEHLRDPVAAFREFWRVLMPAGRLVFLTPNRYDYVSIVAMAIPNALHGKIMKIAEGREEQDTFPTHYRANSVRQIKRLAGMTGFAVERLAYVNHYPYLLTFSPFLCRLGIAYDRIICRFPGLHWLEAWLLGSLRKVRFQQPVRQ